MAKPNSKINWTPVNYVVEPGTTLKATGWAPTDKPYAEHFNWIMKNVSEWVNHLEGYTDDLGSRATSLETSTSSLSSRTTSLETSTSSLSSRTTSLETSTSSLGTRTTSLENRTTSLEARVTSLESTGSTITPPQPYVPTPQQDSGQAYEGLPWRRFAAVTTANTPVVFNTLDFGFEGLPFGARI